MKPLYHCLNRSDERKCVIDNDARSALVWFARFLKMAARENIFATFAGLFKRDRKKIWIITD